MQTAVAFRPVTLTGFAPFTEFSDRRWVDALDSLALSPSALAVGQALFLEADADGQAIVPRWRIAELAQVSPTAVRRAIRALEGAGMLRRSARIGEHSEDLANAYLLTSPDTGGVQ